MITLETRARIPLLPNRRFLRVFSNIMPFSLLFRSGKPKRGIEGRVWISRLGKEYKVAIKSWKLDTDKTESTTIFVTYISYIIYLELYKHEQRVNTMRSLVRWLISIAWERGYRRGIVRELRIGKFKHRVKTLLRWKIETSGKKFHFVSFRLILIPAINPRIVPIEFHLVGEKIGCRGSER